MNLLVTILSDIKNLPRVTTPRHASKVNSISTDPYMLKLRGTGTKEKKKKKTFSLNS